MNSYIFVNDVQIYKFKSKDSEINAAPSRDFSVVNMKKDWVIYGYVYDFHLS